MLKNCFSLSEELCKQIEREGTLRCYEAGDVLYHQGESLDSVFFILSGLVNLWMDTPEHNRSLLNIVGPGTVLGDALLVDSGVRIYNCTTLAPCSVYKIPKAFMQNLANTNIEFSQFLNKELTIKLRAICHSFYRSRLASKTQCLADILLEISVRSGLDTVSITQSQLSHMVGCSRPKIIAELKVLEEQALIRTRYGKIKLMDPSGLKKVAGV